MRYVSTRLAAIACSLLGCVSLDLGAPNPSELLRVHKEICIGHDITVACAYRLVPGDYQKQGEDAESEFFLPAHTEQGGAIVVGAMVDVAQAIQAHKDRSKLCIVTGFRLPVCRDWERTGRREQPIGDRAERVSER